MNLPSSRLDLLFPLLGRSIVLFKRTVEDVPTSKVKGVFYGLNEVKGRSSRSTPFRPP